MISYPIACPEACSLLREKCPELDIDEFYSTSEDGRRYALLHLDRKVRITAIERGLDMLTGCGVNDVVVAGFDGSGIDKTWFAVLERHLNERDARVVVWVKPGKTRSIISGGGGGNVVDSSPQAAEPRQKRLRCNGPIASTSGIEVDSLRQLLAEKDRLLVEKDTKFELALAEKDKALNRALAAKDEEVRVMLFKKEEEEDKLLDEKEAEIHSLKTRAEQGDSVIMRMTADISRLEEKIASAAEMDAELRKRTGDPSRRETELVIDLNAERRRVVELLQQMAVARAGSDDAVAQLRVQIKQLQARLSESESAVAMMRSEAVIWGKERERWNIELRAAAAELYSARKLISELQAKLGDREVGINALKCEARSIVMAEVEGKFLKTINSLQSELKMEKAGGEFKNSEWKRRTEALRDELRSAQQEIATLKQCCSGGGV